MISIYRLWSIIVYRACWFMLALSGMYFWLLTTNFNSRIIMSNQTFNYIIVGGGSAGCILAGQLSKNSKVTILLLEAGPAIPSLLNIPALGPLLQMSPLDWQITTASQLNSCKAFNGNRSRWPLGKVLGGTTHLNYMLHVPGHIDDFKDWADTTSGDWTADDVLNYMRKVEAGMSLRKVPYRTILSRTVESAAEELSLKVSPAALHLDTVEGFAAPLVAMDTSGRRWTADRFLYKNEHSPNLLVKTGARVRRVLFNDRLEAYGVEIMQNDELITVYASNEIILSAGAVHSPQILMLSGIGSPSVLRNAKVNIIRDLPVGRNLQDHLTTGLDLILSERPIFGLSDLASPLSAFQYFAYGTGPLTSTLCELVALLPSNSTPQCRSRQTPAIELMVMMAGASSDAGLLSRHTLGIKDEVWEKYWAPLIGRQTVSIMPVLLHPRSSGDVTLAPEDPYGQPIVDPKYLSHRDDVETLIDGLSLVYMLSTTAAMRDMGFRPNRRIFPGCEGSGVFGSREYWRCYVTHLTLTSYHPVGTCAIGPVLTRQLRVRGVSKLRVADASAMTSLPGGNTHAAVAMIAYKAADLILSDWWESNKPCLLLDAFLPPRYCDILI